MPHLLNQTWLCHLHYRKGLIFSMVRFLRIVPPPPLYTRTLDSPLQNIHITLVLSSCTCKRPTNIWPTVLWYDMSDPPVPVLWSICLTAAGLVVQWLGITMSQFVHVETLNSPIRGSTMMIMDFIPNQHISSFFFSSQLVGLRWLSCTLTHVMSYF